MLERELHGYAVARALDHDGLVVQRAPCLIDVFDEVYYAAVVAVFERAVTVTDRDALVYELYPDAFIEERELFEPTRYHVELEHDGFEYALVGHEPHGRAVTVRSFARFYKVVLRQSALDLAVDFFGLELHAIDLAVAAHLDPQPFAERVGDRRADAVQTARVRVVARVEFAARVELREYYLYARHAELRMNVDGYAASVVLDRRAAVAVDRDEHARSKAVGHLVYRVVDYFP